MGFLLELSENEIFTFYAVLVRFIALVFMMPWLGSRMVPWFLKFFFALTLTAVLFPSLVSSGVIRTQDSKLWSNSSLGILRVLGLEAFFGLLLGYTVRLIFEAVHFGSNLIHGFIGFNSAAVSGIDTNEERPVIGEFYVALATLVFLAIDGHHLVLRAALESYQWVGMGNMHFTGALGQRLLEFSGLVLKYGLQFAAPVGISIFAVNIAIGVSSRALPQANVYVWSVSVTLLVGLAIMFYTLSDFSALTSQVFLKAGDWMREVSRAVQNG